MSESIDELNAVLRIESSEGFILKFQHPGVGELCLPIAEPAHILSMTPEEAGRPPKEDVDVLDRACQTFMATQDLQGAFDAAEAFSKRFPSFAHAYSLQGAFAEALGQLELAALNMRRAIAIQPSFLALSELGRVLGKMGELEDSRIVFRFLFEKRNQIKDTKSAIGFVQGLLVTLTRLGRGEEMVEVADAAIAEYGPATIFHYQGILGLCLSEQLGPAAARLNGVLPHLQNADPLYPKFQQLKHLLESKTPVCIPSPK